MPKEYKECVKSEVNGGKSLKDAQRICAISYYKKHGKTPQQAESSENPEVFSPEEKELFATIEIVGEILVKKST